MLETTNHIFNV